jgi:hypothetical protein
MSVENVERQVAGDDPVLIEELVRALHDEDPNVRSAGRDALTRIGASQAARLRPDPVLVGLKTLVFGFLTGVRILLAILVLLALLLKLFLDFGGR